MFDRSAGLTGKRVSYALARVSGGRRFLPDRGTFTQFNIDTRIYWPVRLTFEQALFDKHRFRCPFQGLPGLARVAVQNLRAGSSDRILGKAPL